jgi:hypothetical protein
MVLAGGDMKQAIKQIVSMDPATRETVAFSRDGVAARGLLGVV